MTNKKIKILKIDEKNLNTDTTLEIYPVSGSWNMGTGKYLDNPITTNGCSWQWQDFSGSKLWKIHSFEPVPQIFDILLSNLKLNQNLSGNISFLRFDKKGKLVVVHACGNDPGNKIIKKIWPKEKPFPSLHGSIIKYIKNNTDKETLKKLKFNKKQNIKYVLRALPNEITGGIATSLIFSAWNAAVYVNQISDEQIMNAERKKYYQKVVKDIVNKNKGLYFNNELFVIEKK